MNSPEKQPASISVWQHLRRVMRPVGVLIGIPLGFAICVWGGKRLEKTDVHKNFVRFHPLITPESLYQPTVEELTAIVRTHVPKDKILVIVGGNSIFLGVGQPVDEVWSKRLQALLGDAYSVVNFSFRGSVVTDGGAVIAEVLRKEYPRQIYISNCAPVQYADVYGSETYRFLFWEAYYRNLLVDWAPREVMVQNFIDHGRMDKNPKEIEKEWRLDSYFHYKSLWHHASYTTFFPVWTFRSPTIPGFLRGRKIWRDEEPDFRKMSMEQKYQPKYLDIELKITRAFSDSFYRRTDQGWEKEQQAWDTFAAGIRSAFPESLRHRTLIMLSRNSPFYTSKLRPDERVRDDLAYKDSIAVWESNGYTAAEYGRDFVPEDFGDRTHLSVWGGDKLATIVAGKVKQMSTELGYIKK